MVEQEKAAGAATKVGPVVVVDLTEFEWRAVVGFARRASLDGRTWGDGMGVNAHALRCVSSMMWHGFDGWEQQMRVGANANTLAEFMSEVARMEMNGDLTIPVLVGACSVVHKLAVELDRDASREEVSS